MRRGFQAVAVIMAIAFLFSAVAPAVAVEAEKKVGVKLSFEQAKYKAVVGVPFRAKLQAAKQAGKYSLDGIFFAVKSKHKKYAKIDKKTGTVTPLKPGTIDVYALSTARGNPVISQCKVKISQNQCQWKVKKSGSGMSIVSPKRVYMSGGKVVGELYVYNKGYRGGLSRIYANKGNIVMVLLDNKSKRGKQVIASVNLGKQKKFAKRIAKGKGAVIKGVFKNVDALDFTTGRYSIALVTGNIRAQGYKDPVTSAVK